MPAAASASASAGANFGQSFATALVRPYNKGRLVQVAACGSSRGIVCSCLQEGACRHKSTPLLLNAAQASANAAAAPSCFVTVINTRAAPLAQAFSTANVAVSWAAFACSTRRDSSADGLHECWYCTNLSLHEC